MGHSEQAFQLPLDLVPACTGDGSFTLHCPGLGEHYHSRHGAATESRHVYIRNGLQACGKRKLSVLEVGLGTGLNALLTWMECVHSGLEVEYVALEPFPLPWKVHADLRHAHILGGPEWVGGFDAMMAVPSGEQKALSNGFAFRWEQMRVQELDATDSFDLVYFDAFAPKVQPAMWTGEVFARTARAMRTGGLLVTYCVKGSARRAMEQAGLRTERLPGPPGKKQMLRATKQG